MARVELSESLLNDLTYISIRPFLIEPSQTSFQSVVGPNKPGRSHAPVAQSHGGMAAISMECLRLLRHVSPSFSHKITEAL